MTPTLLLLLALQAPPPPVVKATDLKPVPGPMGQYPDPAGDPMASRMTLEIRHSARQGPSIPAVAVPTGSVVIQDVMSDVAGRKAYLVEAPPKATVHAILKGTHTAWFVVMAMNKWGKPEEGMLQNMIPTGNPEASFRNPSDQPKTFYFVVDTRELEMRGEAYELRVTVKQP